MLVSFDILKAPPFLLPISFFRAFDFNLCNPFKTVVAEELLSNSPSSSSRALVELSAFSNYSSSSDKSSKLRVFASIRSSIVSANTIMSTWTKKS